MRSAKMLVPVAAMALLIGCQSGGNNQGQNPQSAGFALQTSSAGGKASVTLRSSAGGPYGTLIGELTYDASQLTFKDCVLSASISDSSGVGNTLNVFQPAPGRVRAVMVGGLEPLPQATDWFTCRFDVAAGSPRGTAAVSLRGNVADTNYVDEIFTADGSVKIGG
jgi:hypothetical protein